MLRGDLPSSVPDTAGHPRTAAMPVIAALGVACYNGVPTTLADGSLYRAAASDADSAARTQMLHVLARVVALQVDRQLAGRRCRDADQLLHFAGAGTS